MKDLISAEVLKLRTTRGAFLLLLGTVGIVVFTIVAPGENALRELAHPLHEQQGVLIVSMLTRILLLVLGIKAVTEEFRHGTITPTLLAAPRRHKVVAAKAVALAGAGAIFALVTVATMLLSMNLVANMNDITVAPLGDGSRTLLGTLATGVIWPVFGLGIGLLVRSQVAAIVGGVVWLMGLEQMIGGRLGRLSDFLPGEAGLAGAIAPSSRALWIGSLALFGWAVLTSLGGAFMLRRRDIG